MTINYIHVIQNWQKAVTTVPDGILPNLIPSQTDLTSSTEEWAKATILCTFNNLPPDPKLAPNLHLIHFLSAGTNHIATHPIYKDTDINLTTSSGVHGPQIAEWVVMQILSNSHREKLLLEWQKEHRWGTHAEVGPIRDSVGQRLGVLGYGSIGRQS